MTDLIYFCLGALVTYRLALMISKENGPGRLFLKLRNWAKFNCTLHEGISCVHCESIWWAAPTTAFLVWREAFQWQDAGLVWLALSAAAIALHHTFTKDFKQ